MGDQENGCFPLAHLPDDFEYLGLNGDIQRGGGLVGDDDPRLEHQGHGDHDPLLHPSGKLMGISAHPLFRIGNPDLPKPLLGHLGGCISTDVPMEPDRLDQLPADFVKWGKRRAGFLEDHADGLPSNPAHFPDGQA